MWDIMKYYDFHKDNGDTTSNYYQLREQIENLIQNGQLRQYIECTMAKSDCKWGAKKAVIKEES